MEISKGKFTGNIIGQVVTKHNKVDNIPEGSLFIGDKHDENVIMRNKVRNFEFIKLQ